MGGWVDFEAHEVKSSTRKFVMRLRWPDFYIKRVFVFLHFDFFLIKFKKRSATLLLIVAFIWWFSIVKMLGH